MRDYASFLQKDAYAIFLFHGVIREQRFTVRNYTRKHLLVDAFSSVLSRLCSMGVPVSLEEIVHVSLHGGRLPDYAFAVTFDDGFENNFSVAAPILREFDIPATFYVTTGFIDGNSVSWTDMIEHAFETTSTFQLKLNGWPVPVSCTTPDEKVELLNSIRWTLKKDRGIDPYAFASDICQQLRVGPMDRELELDKKMTWDQVRALSEDRLFAIGGHSHTHRVLSFLEKDALEDEIGASLRELRKHLGHQIEHYSYPEGLQHCYSELVIATLRQSGILCAPTAEEGINHAGDDLFRLKRIAVV